MFFENFKKENNKIIIPKFNLNNNNNISVPKVKIKNDYETIRKLVLENDNQHIEKENNNIKKQIKII